MISPNSSPSPPTQVLPQHCSSRTQKGEPRKLVLSPRLSPLKPKLPKKSPNKKKIPRWSSDETRVFLQVYADWEKSLRTKGKKKTVWTNVHKQFLLSCKKAKITTERDIRQLQDKVRYLTTQYKRIKDNNRRTGCSREDWEFFDEMDEILVGRENINPSDFLDACEDTPISIQNQLNEIDTDPETENLEDQPVEKRPKRAAKTSVMSDAVNHGLLIYK